MKKVGLPVAGGIRPQGQVIKELKHGRPDQNSQRVCSFFLFFSPPDFEMLFFCSVTFHHTGGSGETFEVPALKART